jgi:hypothetical protein
MTGDDLMGIDRSMQRRETLTLRDGGLSGLELLDQDLEGLPRLLDLVLPRLESRLTLAAAPRTSLSQFERLESDGRRSALFPYPSLRGGCDLREIGLDP